MGFQPENSTQDTLRSLGIQENSSDQNLILAKLSKFRNKAKQSFDLRLGVVMKGLVHTWWQLSGPCWARLELARHAAMSM